MRKRELIATRPAGDDHAVLTIEGANHSYRREPCETCPWRVDMIGEFPAEAFRLTANVGADMAHHDDPKAAEVLQRSHHVFACHTSGAEKPTTCAGYILRGTGALSWRLAVARGVFCPSEVSDGGHALFENYRAMAIANGVDEDDPTLAFCVREPG